MSSTAMNIFMIGVTGYIGGSVLTRFLERPDAASLKITALVRSPDKAKQLKALGVNAVLGSYSDLALVEKLASGADFVIAMADADNLEAARATLKGLEKRHKATGVVPSFIQTSGTGVLIDNAEGMYAYDTIYYDDDPDQIETLAPTQPHRNVDLELVEADKQGYVKVYIILPSTIYGIATGKLVQLGIQNPYSQQVPSLIKASLDRGQGGMVGLGVNLWPNVHIDEVADLYGTLYDSIISNPATGHGREGFYFGENGEHSLYQVGQAISQALLNLGYGNFPEPTTFNPDEIKKYFGTSRFLGSNSRCRANRSRSIGWRPTKTTYDLLESILPEARIYMKK